MRRRLADNLESRKTKGTFRQLTFHSNDYLGFASSPALRDRLLANLTDTVTPYGPASSRLLDGNSTLHLKLEKDLASFFNGPAALLFNSGFDANVSMFSTLLGENDVLLYDDLIHASTHDGVSLWPYLLHQLGA